MYPTNTADVSVRNSSQNKIVYLEAVRLFAILCVMFTHSGPRGSNYYQYTDSLICYIWSLSLELLSDIGVPLFLMVSGVLLLKKEEPLKAVYTKRLPRMVIVLLVFSFIRYLYECFIVSTMTFSILDFIRLFWTGTLFLPFWYLYTYIGILIILPFLRKMVRNMTREEGILFLLLCVVFNILVPMVNVATGTSFNIAFYLESYIVTMITGYVLEYVVDIKFSGKILIPSAILTMIVCIALMFPEPFRYKLLYPVTTCAFLIIKKINWLANEKMSRFLVQLGSYTFGLYLIEDYLRNLFGFIFDSLCNIITPILANAVWLSVVFIVGMILVGILKKIPLIKKYI